MYKKLKMLIISMVIVSLPASLLVGCANKTVSTPGKQANSTSSPGNTSFKADKPMQFSMLYSDQPTYPEQDNWLLWSAIKAKTNVSLKLTMVPMSDYAQKRSLLISTGDAPEIIPKTYPGSEVPFIASGAILPISDYVNQMPNFEKKVKEWNLQPDLKTLDQKDGKYYVLPGLHQSLNQDYSYAIRTDILQKNGLKIPNTYDELYTVLKQLKKIYPNSYPWSDRYQGKNTLSIAAPTFGATAGWNTGNGMMYDQKKNQFVFSPITDQYKSMLTYFSKLVKEGLLDPESFTQSDDQAIQKFVTGKSFVISANSQDIITYEKAMDGTLGANKYKIIKMVDPAGPAGPVLAGSRLENGIMFTTKAAKDPNFSSMLKFIDWLYYSDAGQTLTKWGVAGTTYQVVNGKNKLMPDVTFQSMNPSGTKDLRKQFGFSGGVFSYGGSENLMESMMSPDDLKFQAAVVKTRTVIPPAPPVLFDEDQNEQSTLISQPLMDYVNEMTLKFILGNSSLPNDWNSFVQECNTKGSSKLSDLTNKVYSSTKGSIK